MWTRTRRIFGWMLLVVIAMACSLACDRSHSDAATSAESAATVQSPAAPGSGSGAGVAVAQAEEVSAERYPGLMFALLEPAERVDFVRIASSELCPCDGAPASLDTCLQSIDASCEVALQVGALIMRRVKEQAGDVEILDEVQQYVENTRRVHTFDLEGVPTRGSETATVTVVEFADFQCPHCAQLSTVMSELHGRYGDRVRFYYKQFPLQSHPNAFAASVASLAAHRQGSFWPYESMVFSNQDRLGLATDPTPLLVQWAGELGLNTERFAADLASPELAAQVNADRAEGMTAGLQATPTVFINGVMLLEDYTLDGIAARIDAALAAP
jgi:protein-disulfide isomerase